MWVVETTTAAPEIHASRSHPVAHKFALTCRGQSWFPFCVLEMEGHRDGTTDAEANRPTQRNGTHVLAAAQAGGDIRKAGGDYKSIKLVHDEEGAKPPTAADVGLSWDEVYQARKVRDTEVASPGITRAVLDDFLEEGREPSKRAVAIEINTRLNSFSGDNEWYTPARYIDMAREVMGSIDVDPASNATAQAVVRAKIHYTIDTDGLEIDWHGNLWMNPPYSNPEIQNFVEHLIAQVSKGNVKEAIVLTNNSADTGWHHDLQAACSRLCLTRGRIRFESPTRASNSPAMGQSFFYFGENPERFREVFSEIGTVWMMA